MKHRIPRLLLCVFLLASCKKSGIIDLNKDAPEGKHPEGKLSQLYYQISNADYLLLKSAFVTNDVKKIDSLKKAICSRSDVIKEHSEKSGARTASIPIEPESEDYTFTSGDATDYFYDPILNWNGDYDYVPQYGGRSNIYISYVNMDAYFNRRGNKMYVKFPFSYYEAGGGAWKDPAGYFGTNISRIWVEGNKLGDFDNGNFYLTYNIQNPAREHNPVIGNSEGGTQETRTVVFALEGKMKIMGKIEGAGIEVGAELEAGFTVSSKYNSTSIYQYVANFDITINRFPDRPTIHYNLGGTCSGIQQN